jgi:hypothetical protein
MSLDLKKRREAANNLFCKKNMGAILVAKKWG